MTLFVVSTPIGNLEDFSFRAKNILQTVDLIAAEDKRKTLVLLARWSIEKPMIAMHDHNEKDVLEKVIGLLKSGKTIALVSDAGTPLISDPGYALVRECRANNIVVSPIPGPCSVIAALSVAGLPTNQFSFRGFAPAKAKDRMTFLRKLSDEPFTQVFFETPHRIAITIAAMVRLMPGRDVVICRELTKKFEQVIFSPIEKIQEMFSSAQIPIKGEFVIVVRGFEVKESKTDDLLLNILLTEMSPSRAASVASKFFSSSRRELYERAMKLKELLDLES
tara:strand:+ start:1034 stop:1867 length:834 start_codon:yes stop_codon:yes gene_type:complete